MTTLKGSLHRAKIIFNFGHISFRVMFTFSDFFKHFFKTYLQNAKNLAK